MDLNSFSVKALVKAITFSMLVIYALYLGYKLDLPYIKFIPSTISIVFITFVFYKKKWLDLLGLRSSFRQLAQAFVLMLLFCAISFLVISWSLSANGHALIFAEIFDYFVVPFQTLNEEMIFRSLLLSILLKLGLSKNKTVILPALIFSLFHWVFYSYIMLPENRGPINLEALITLFMFGVAANSLFLKFRNIYFSWALHCGWNMHRFGSKIAPIGESDFRKGVHEYMTFNLLEGSTLIMILSIFLAAACLAKEINGTESAFSRRKQRRPR